MIYIGRGNGKSQKDLEKLDLLCVFTNENLHNCCIKRICAYRSICFERSKTKNGCYPIRETER